MTTSTPDQIRSGSAAQDVSWLGPDFDPLLLNPTRLLLMSELVTDSYYRFGYLCEMVGANPSAMYRQVAWLRTVG